MSGSDRATQSDSSRREALTQTRGEVLRSLALAELDSAPTDLLQLLRGRLGLVTSLLARPGALPHAATVIVLSRAHAALEACEQWRGTTVRIGRLVPGRGQTPAHTGVRRTRRTTR
jgi:hypothetical protein